MMRRIAENIVAAAGTPQVFIFNEQVIRLPEGIRSADFQCSTKYTLIDNAFDTVRHSARPDIIWLITDNVQDESGLGGVRGNTEAFYQRLQTNEVQRIYVFPCFLQFDGILTDAYGSPSYYGERGALVYAILLNSNQQDYFEREVTNFEQRVQHFNAKRLFCKPLDQNTLEFLTPDSDDIHVELQAAGLEPPNLFYENGEFYGKGFKTGAPIHAVGYIQFRSKFDDLAIDAQLKESRGQLQTIGFKEPQVEYTITPKELSLNPGATSKFYKITLDLPQGVSLKKDISSILYAVFNHSKGKVSGKVNVNAIVPRDSFRFRDEILNTYHTDSLDEERKIYKLGSLVSMMSQNTIQIPAMDANVNLNIEYPWWPFWLLLFIIAVVVVLIILLVKLLSAREQFAVVVDGDERTVSLSAWGSYPIIKNRAIVARIKRFGGFRVNALRGYLINGQTKSKRLNKHLDSFNVEHPSDGTSLQVEVRSARRQAFEEPNMNSDMGEYR
jgi:hypothetical protein